MTRSILKNKKIIFRKRSTIKILFDDFNLFLPRFRALLYQGMHDRTVYICQNSVFEFDDGFLVWKNKILVASS